MKCPACGGETEVLEKRGARRRRQCRACTTRFTTEERVVARRLRVPEPQIAALPGRERLPEGE